MSRESSLSFLPVHTQKRRSRFRRSSASSRADPHVALRIRPPRRQVERFFGNGPALGGHIVFHRCGFISDHEFTVRPSAEITGDKLPFEPYPGATSAIGLIFQNTDTTYKFFWFLSLLKHLPVILKAVLRRTEKDLNRRPQGGRRFRNRFSAGHLRSGSCGFPQRPKGTPFHLLIDHQP